MEKRTRLAVVVLVGLILFLIGLWIFLTPILKERQPAAQPPALPSAVTPQEQPDVYRPREAPVVQAKPDAKPTEASGMLALQNYARSLTERIGSGTSANGFLGYTDVFIDSTANGRSALTAARTAMQQAHPASGPSYSVIAKALTAKTGSGAYGDAQVAVLMDVLVVENPGRPDQSGGTNHVVGMTFAKQSDGTYLLDAFTWK